MALVMLRASAGRCGRGALLRRRGQGRAALDVIRRPVDPAFGVPEAGLRRRLPPGCSPSSKRQPDVPGNLFAMLLLASSSRCWCCSPISARRCSSRWYWGGCSSWPGCPGSGSSRLGGCGVGGVVRRLYALAARRGRIDRSSTRRRAIRSRSTGAASASSMAAGSARPGRRHRQADPARQPRRLHLRGRRRGVRHRHVPCCIVSIFAFIVLRGLDTRAARSRRISRAMRRPGWSSLFGLQSVINMVRQPAADAGQGHDAAVHLLWRLVADRHGLSMGMLLALTRKRPEQREQMRLRDSSQRAQPAE